MKLTKKQLLTISNLKLSGTLNDMSDSQFEEYCKALGSFIEKLPAYQESLKKSFEARDVEDFSKNLLSLVDVLTKIYASSLAQGSFNLLKGFREEKYVIAEALLNEFLTSASTLSIDIQMAQYKAVDGTDMGGVFDRGGEIGGEKIQKSILAVDDVSFLLNTLKALLINSEYKFTGVTSGNVALKFLQTHKPDLFILDIEMPEMNGYELAKKIREMKQTAPIIFLTGNATSEYVLKALQAGAADFIVKPVNKECVLEKIKKYIGD